MHVDDAAELQIADGDVVRVSSRARRRSSVPVTATKDIVAGVIAIPHGWGHKGTGGWRVANARGRCQRQPADVERTRGHRSAGRDGPADGRAGPGRAAGFLTTFP